MSHTEVQIQPLVQGKTLQLGLSWDSWIRAQDRLGEPGQKHRTGFPRGLQEPSPTALCAAAPLCPGPCMALAGRLSALRLRLSPAVGRAQAEPQGARILSRTLPAPRHLGIVSSEAQL